MIILKILITLFIFSNLFKLFQAKKSGKISLSSFVSWGILWISIGIIFYQPEISNQLASWLGIGRGADLLIYLSIIAIFYILFKMIGRFQKLNSEITKIAREIAIQKAEDNRDKN